MLTLRYRLRYWYRWLCRALGFCPICGTRLNWTSSGRPICPECGK